MHMLNQAAAVSFERLREIAENLCPLPPLPQKMCNVHLDYDMIDHPTKIMAQKLRPFGENFFPIKSKANNSCFYASASRLVCGSQDRDVEMRVRIIVDMALHLDSYLDHEILTNGHTFAQNEQHKDHQNMASVLLALSLEPTTWENYRDHPESWVQLMEGMVREWTHVQEWANIFAFQALANITRQTVQSYYPSWEETAEEQFVDTFFDLNRQFRPREPRVESQDDPDVPLVIAWTALGPDSTTFNHFVPVVP